MVTKIIEIDPFEIDSRKISEAANAIKNGGIVAFPTETVYGLGANALDEGAVRAIFAAKGRPADNPLIIHVSSIKSAREIAKDVPENALMLMERFWGGPLTIILKSAGVIPKSVSGGLDTIGIRLPSHPVALALIDAAGVPIAAPSANLSGRPSPTSAADVFEDLFGRVDIVISGGAPTFGIESTVLDMTVPVPAILRPGAVSFEQLSQALGGRITQSQGEGAAKSPGMRYRHYSPAARVFSVSGPGAADYINEKAGALGGRAAVIAPDDFNFGANIALAYGKSPSDYAARLFFLLREADRRGALAVFALEPEAAGIGTAVINRLRKAAGERVVKTKGD